MLDDGLIALVEGAQALALDPTSLDGWMAQLSRAFDASLGTFTVCGWDGALRSKGFWIDDPHRVERYAALDIDAHDPQLGYAVGLDRLSLYVDTDHRDVADPTIADFMSGVRSTIGTDHYMTAVMPLREEGLRVGVSVNRAWTEGHTPTIEWQRMAAILTPLAHAFRLAFGQAEKLQTAYWEGLTATRSEPAMLLGERTTVVRVTDDAAALLARSDALDIVGGRLRCGDPAADAALHRVVGAAVRRALPAAGSVALPSRSGRRPLILSAFPLARSHRMLAPYEAAALVTIVDPTARRAGDTQRWATAFGLTPREAELAAALAVGHSIESAAALLTIGAGTARLHLHRVFAKTQTTRQADLIALLLRL